MIDTDLKRLVEICHANLINCNDCKDYLASRGIDKKIIKEYKIGYFPQNLGILTKYVSKESLIKKSIIKSDNTSDFKDYHYLIIPFMDEYGNAVGISGRSLLSSGDLSYFGVPKYRNSSFNKSNYLFGLNKAIKHIVEKKEVWVVEGYFDQIALYKNGIKNCVALSGTSFTNGHLMKLKRYCNKINFLFDNDDAGRINAERTLKKSYGVDTSMLFYEFSKYKDVDEFLRNEGIRELEKSLKRINFGA